MRLYISNFFHSDYWWQCCVNPLEDLRFLYYPSRQFNKGRRGTAQNFIRDCPPNNHVHFLLARGSSFQTCLLSHFSLPHFVSITWFACILTAHSDNSDRAARQIKAALAAAPGPTRFAVVQESDFLPAMLASAVTPLAQ